MFNSREIDRLQQEIQHRDVLILEFLNLMGTQSSCPVYDFQKYLHKFKKTKAEQEERAKIESIILSLVKKTALKDQ